MPNQRANPGDLRLIRCGLGRETYGLDMAWVRGIQRAESLRPNPAAGEPAGWLPTREGDVPVYSLASRFGQLRPAGVAPGRVITLNPLSSALSPSPNGGEPGRGAPPWALLVDRVSQVISVPADRMEPLPPVAVNPSANYFQGVVRLGQELILLLAPERLHPEAPAPPPSGAFAPPLLRASAPLPPRSSAGRGRIIVFSTTAPRPGERAVSFGLSVTQAPEILHPPPVTPVPAAPAFVQGLVNWRDRPVPVIDLDVRLGLASESPPSAEGRTRLIVVRDRGAAGQDVLAGVRIQPAIRVLRLPLAHRPSDRALPLDRALVRCVVELDDETLVIPDVRAMLQ